jgi:hypothetical protein
VLVFMEDAAESVASSDVEPVEWASFGDRLGRWSQWCGGVDRVVGPVLVVGRFVLAEGVQKVSLVDDQAPVQEFGLAGSCPAFHDRVHAWCADAGRRGGDALAGEDRIERGLSI